MERQEAKKLARSLFGKQQAPDTGVEETGKILPIRFMVENLLKLDEEAFGSYAWSREPLERKFDEIQKREYTVRAAACGRAEAGHLKSELHTASPEELAKKLGLKVDTPDLPGGGGRVLFAQYVEPDEVTVFMDTVKKAEECIARESLRELIGDVPVYELLLAHEVFHAVEYQNRERIFTKTEKIELWRKPFSNRSEIIALGEIAGMAFAGELLGLSFSPYLFDVLLMYGYHEEAATAIYEEMMEFAGEPV